MYRKGRCRLQRGKKGKNSYKKLWGKKGYTERKRQVMALFSNS